MSAAEVTDLRRRAGILRRIRHGKPPAQQLLLLRDARRLDAEARQLESRPFAAGCPDRCETRRLCLTGCARGRRP